jgi:hemolysin III
MYQGERLNSITHLVGTGLATVGASVLVIRASDQGDPLTLTGVSFFAFGLVILYLASTLYHAVKGPLKALLRRVDHAAVFVLIAGTYAPFALGPLRGTLGWTLFSLVWLLSLAGIWQACRRDGNCDPSPLPHLVLGWLGAATLIPLSDALGTVGMTWLAAGGVLYTCGVLFYLNDRRWRHAHGIWHLFVMAGSASHFVTVFYLVG